MSAPSLALIAVAGALGTLLRYVVSVGMASLLGAQFPFGTLLVNLVGSGALGFVAEAMGGQTILGAEARLVLGVGLLGGFTTYSSFNLELVRQLEGGAPARAALYLGGTVFGCLAAGALGIALARAVVTANQG